MEELVAADCCNWSAIRRQISIIVRKENWIDLGNLVNINSVPSFLSTSAHSIRKLKPFKIDFHPQSKLFPNIVFRLRGVVHSIDDNNANWSMYLSVQHCDQSLEINNIAKRTYELEREKFAAELHSGIAQIFVMMNMQINTLVVSSEKELDTISTLKETIQQGLRQTRSLTYILTPPDLDHGFVTALKSHVERIKQIGSITVSMMIEDGIADNSFTKLDIYHIFMMVYEFTDNSINHADCSQLFISLYRSGNRYVLSVADNGKGFDNENVNPGNGLKNIKKWSLMTDTLVNITSRINKGSLMEITIQKND
jgi:signal transduction histidine kinase